MLFLLTGTTLHKDIVYSVMSKYVWDNIAQHSFWCSVGPDHIVMFSKEKPCEMLPWSAWANSAQENYLCNIGPQFRNNLTQKNNLQFYLDLSRPTLLKEITCGILALS